MNGFLRSLRHPMISVGGEMKKLQIRMLILCLGLLGICQAALAQSTPALPNVLWIVREDVKPARGPVHEKVEQGFSQFWGKSQVQPFFALDAVSGNATEVMFLSGYGSFAAFEKDFRNFSQASGGPLKTEYETLIKQEAELINSSRSIIAVLRPDISYHPDRFMPDLPKARYLQISTMRTRPGKQEDFAHGAKIYRDAYEKIEAKMPWAVYEVMSGAPSGTYLIFSAHKSLADIDEGMAMRPKLQDALGENAGNMNKGAAETFVSMENSIFAFNPRMSYVSKAFAAADPDFWTPKPKVSENSAQESIKAGK
jgi:hypothetical protein